MKFILHCQFYLPAISLDQLVKLLYNGFSLKVSIGHFLWVSCAVNTALSVKANSLQDCNAEQQMH